MGLEFELKYGANEQVQNAIQRDFSGNWESIRMETTYFDTPGRILCSRHWTLRRRLENGRSVCTVKTPGGDNCRGEWEAEATTIEEGIKKLCKQGGPAELAALTKQGVIEVCGARFTRRANTISFGDAQLELALDAGILFAGAAQIPLCEVEVELKAGDAAQAVAFGKLLQEKYGLKTETKSKFARARALGEG